MGSSPNRDALQRALLRESISSDAPSNGSEYARKNGAWVVASGGGGGGGGGTTVKLLSATRTGTGSIPTNANSVLTWDAPALNQGTWSYSSGVFTVPSGLNGASLRFDAMAGGDGGNSRVELTLTLQKDTGSGYVAVAQASDYVTRSVTQDVGGVTFSFIDPTAAATGDKYRFLFYRQGGGLNYKPLMMQLGIMSFA